MIGFLVGVMIGAVAGSVATFFFVKNNPQKAAVAVSAVDAAGKAIDTVVSAVKK